MIYTCPSYLKKETEIVGFDESTFFHAGKSGIQSFLLDAQTIDWIFYKGQIKNILH